METDEKLEKLVAELRELAGLVAEFGELAELVVVLRELAGREFDLANPQPDFWEKVLIPLLSHEKAEVRYLAAWALARYMTKETEEALEARGAVEKEGSVGERIAESLRQIRKRRERYAEISPPLRELGIRTGAVVRGVLDELMPLVDESMPEERARAAELVSTFRTGEAERVLAKAKEREPYADARARIADAQGRAAEGLELFEIDNLYREIGKRFDRTGRNWWAEKRAFKRAIYGNSIRNAGELTWYLEGGYGRAFALWRQELEERAEVRGMLEGKKRTRPGGVEVPPAGRLMRMYPQLR